MSELKPFVIRIEEILSRNIIVCAENEKEAIQKAEDLYFNKGAVELGDRDYQESTVDLMREAEVKDLEELMEYGEDIKPSLGEQIQQAEIEQNSSANSEKTIEKSVEKDYQL